MTLFIGHYTPLPKRCKQNNPKHAVSVGKEDDLSNVILSEKTTVPQQRA
jgi:hypothetical protein